jgi:hypothetical protein
MKLKRIGVFVAFLLLLVISVVFLPSHLAFARDARDVTIPKSYGVFKGAAGQTGQLAYFEDSSGTLRVVDMNDGSIRATYHRE